MSIKLKTSAINFMKDGSKKGVADLLHIKEKQFGKVQYEDLPEGVPYAKREVIFDNNVYTDVVDIGIPNMFFARVSDITNEDELFGNTIKIELYGGLIEEVKITPDDVTEKTDNYCVFTLLFDTGNREYNFVVAYKDNSIVMGAEFLTKGIYTMCGSFSPPTVCYKDTISKLDERCLPSEAIESIIDAKLNALTNVSEEGQ